MNIMHISANQKNSKSSSRRAPTKPPEYETPFTDFTAAVEEMLFLAEEKKKEKFVVAIGIAGVFYVMPAELAEGLQIVDSCQFKPKPGIDNISS